MLIFHQCRSVPVTQRFQATVQQGQGHRVELPVRGLVALRQLIKSHNLVQLSDGFEPLQDQRGPGVQRPPQHVVAGAALCDQGHASGGHHRPYLIDKQRRHCPVDLLVLEQAAASFVAGSSATIGTVIGIAGVALPDGYTVLAELEDPVGLAPLGEDVYPGVYLLLADQRVGLPGV